MVKIEEIYSLPHQITQGLLGDSHTEHQISSLSQSIPEKSKRQQLPTSLWCLSYEAATLLTFFFEMSLK